MKKYLWALAAFSVLLSGCGKDEEPMQQSAAPQEEASAMEQAAEPAAATEEAAPAQSAEAMPEESAAAADEAAATSGPAAAEEAPAATEETAMADNGQGKKIYDSVCFACHSTGAAGAPVTGDKAAWAPRIEKGMETLVNNANNGFQGETGVMPPKGGRMDLSDEAVAAAVTYMVEQSR